MNVDWNADRVKQLEALWLEGKSCSVIARIIGSGATRSGIIGKVHRLGLAGRLQPHAEQAHSQRSPKAPKPPAPPAVILEPATPDLPLVLESGAFVTLETVSDRMCRWPHGDPAHADFHFCGRRPRPGAPYCEDHCKKAYQPTHAPLRPTDGRLAANRRQPIRRGQVSMWE